MIIVFFANADSVHSHRWIRYFAEQTDFMIHWVSLTPSIDHWFQGKTHVVFHELKKPFWAVSPLSILWYRSYLKQFLSSLKPDLLHAHYAGVNGFVAALSGFHPFVLTAWGSDVLLAGKHRVKKYLISYVLQSADLITCDAEHMKRAILSFGIPESRINIIQFGIDTKLFSPGTCKQALKEKLRIPYEHQTVISMRNFHSIYDIETVIRSVPAIIKECPETIFLIGGRGPQQEYLEGLARELGVEDAVRFMGFIPNNELQDYLRCATVYVSTSLSDAGIASSTAEAMACGVPVVVTDSGENTLWIRDSEDGFVIPQKNQTVLAEKVILLLCDPAMRDRFSQHGRSIIVERDDYWTEMKKMKELYQSLYSDRVS